MVQNNWARKCGEIPLDGENVFWYAELLTNDGPIIILPPFFYRKN